MNSNDKADAAWDDYINQQQEEKIEELKRELNAANDRIKRLEDVGNSMAAWLSNPRNLGDDPFMASQWRKAKEAKP